MRLRRRRSAATDVESESVSSADLADRLQRAERQLRRLRRRLETVESELQEARHLNKRLAEISDVVAEVLLPALDRDDERVRAALARYDATL